MEKNYDEKSKLNFRFLTDIIEGWMDRMASRNKGQMYFLINSRIAELIITKYGKTRPETWL